MINNNIDGHYDGTYLIHIREEIHDHSDSHNIKRVFKKTSNHSWECNRIVTDKIFVQIK